MDPLRAHPRRHPLQPGRPVGALPDVWTRASPERALDARRYGAVEALRRLADDTLPDRRLTEAVKLIEAATAALEPAGRVLGAANAALPRPEEPLGRLWQATTTLREHRGDGHVAALVERGWLDGAGRATAAGLDGYRQVEATTDALAAAPCHQALSAATPIGVPVPSVRG